MADSSVPSSSNPSRLHRALKRVLPLLNAMPDSALLPLNVDPVAVVAKVRGALPTLLLLRNQIASDLNAFDLAQLDELETYAHALLQADAVYRSITARSRSLSQLSPEASLLRARLLCDAKTLVKHGLIPESRLSRLKGRKGHRNVATDLLTLREVLRDSWPVIANNTPLSLVDLERAEALGDEMIQAIGESKQVTVQAANAALVRHRAFSLVVRTYEEVRWAVRYLRRHEGDAARIAPSLYHRPKPKRKKGNRDTLPVTSSNREGDALSPEPAPADGSPFRVSENGVDTKKIGVGDPGSDPFLN